MDKSRRIISSFNEANSVLYSGMDEKQFEELIIAPTLKEMGLYTPQAAKLLLRTAKVESNLRYIKQLGTSLKIGGIGLYQMEKLTHDDIHKNFLIYRDDRPYYQEYREPLDMIWDLRYATQMARLHYLRVATPIPDSLEGQAAYWKQRYNTPLGKGTIERFIGINKDTT